MTWHTELPFRMAASGLMIAFIAIRWLFQWRQRTVKTRTTIRTGREYILWALNSLGSLGLLYLITPWLDPFHVAVPTVVRWAGGVIGLAGVIGFWWTHHTLGKNWSPVLEIRQEHTLITEGPYRLVRHPMYTTFIVIGTGLGLLTANWVVALTFLGPFILLYLLRVDSEEAMMLAQFGPEYERYMHRTGRLIPKRRH